MIAGIISDVSLLLSASALVVLAITAAMLVYRRTFKSFDAKLGAMQVSLQAVDRVAQETGKKIEGIEKSVNNVGANAPTLIQRVKGLETTCSNLAQRCARIERNQEKEQIALAHIAENIGVTIHDRRESEDSEKPK